MKRFHDRQAEAYLAYAYDDHPAVYPTGARRLDAAMVLAAQRDSEDSPVSAVDLGCGRGDLCARLAASGHTVIGVDFSDTMIAEAERLSGVLPSAVRDRITFVRRDAFDNDLPAASFGLVTALGVLETEDDDSRLFREAHRLLQPGGTFIVSARNRLFNLVSVNRHTRHEIAAGTAVMLLDEIETLLQRTRPEEFRAACRHVLRRATPDPDREREGQPAAEPPVTMRLTTRQHTPLDLERSASNHGFCDPIHVGVHPHVLPPVLERLAPELYNTLCKEYEPLAHLPVGLIWSSALVSSMTKA